MKGTREGTRMYENGRKRGKSSFNILNNSSIKSQFHAGSSPYTMARSNFLPLSCPHFSSLVFPSFGLVLFTFPVPAFVLLLFSLPFLLPHCLFSFSPSLPFLYFSISFVSMFIAYHCLLVSLLF